MNDILLFHYAIVPKIGLLITFEACLRFEPRCSVGAHLPNGKEEGDPRSQRGYIASIAPKYC